MNLAETRRIARNTRPTRVNDEDYYSLEGGLNLVAASLKVKPGELLGCLNFEAKVEGGYRRSAGYERFDGRTLPSQAPYWVVAFDAQGNVANDAIVGATITAASGGTAVVLKFEDDDNDGIGEIIVGRLTGTWTDDTALSSGAFSALLDGAPVQNSTTTDERDLEYHALATADQRAQIAALPGSGPVRGVVLYRGLTYAFRDNAGGTACVMYVESSSGWTAVALGWKLKFTAGQAAGIAEGDTLTGNTSGATATVRRIVITSGTFSGNDAAGYLILTGLASGPYQNSESLRVGGTNRATADGASAAQTLAPGGRYEFRVRNFYGHTRTTRLYGVDGVNRGFEFQDGAGAFFCQIETGMTNDAPQYLAVHQNQLWYAFQGGSIQKSGVFDPAQWTILTGAAELGIGDEPTGFLEEVGTVLFVFARNITKYIEGTADGYAMRDYNIEVGAMPWTIQRIGQGTYLDDRGFATLATTDRFGNYAGNSISSKVAPLITELKAIATASCISKNQNLYRCFFSDGQIVSITMRDRAPIAHLRCDWGRVVRCIFSGELVSGAERIVFGSDDGYVYVADSGTSFDGAPITAFLRLPFHHSRAPARIKRYRRAEFDIVTEGSCEVSIGVDYTYARTDVPGDPVHNVDLIAGGGFWDVSRWDQFRWNSGYQGRVAIKLEGSGQNLSFLISSESTLHASYAVDGVSLQQSFRRLERVVS